MQLFTSIQDTIFFCTWKLYNYLETIAILTFIEKIKQISPFSLLKPRKERTFNAFVRSKLSEEFEARCKNIRIELFQSRDDGVENEVSKIRTKSNNNNNCLTMARLENTVLVNYLWTFQHCSIINKNLASLSFFYTWSNYRMEFLAVLKILKFHNNYCLICLK